MLIGVFENPSLLVRGLKREFERKYVVYNDKVKRLVGFAGRNHTVPRFGAGGNNQPPKGTLEGFSGRCYNTCPDGSVVESLFLSSSPSVGDRAASG